MDIELAYQRRARASASIATSKDTNARTVLRAVPLLPPLGVLPDGTVEYLQPGWPIPQPCVYVGVYGTAGQDDHISDQTIMIIATSPRSR